MNKKKIFTLILGILPLIMVAISYPSLPNQVPTQWNNGIVSYGHKSTLFIMASISLLICFGMPFIRKIDPKKDNYEKFDNVYQTLQIVLEIFFLFVTAIILLESFNPGKLNVENLVYGWIGPFFMILGNIMPKIKANFFTGIKTPWTLSSETVWYKTHRLAGKTFFFGGLILFLLWLLCPVSISHISILVVSILIATIPIVASYFWYKEENQKKGE